MFARPGRRPGVHIAREGLPPLTPRPPSYSSTPRHTSPLVFLPCLDVQRPSPAPSPTCPTSPPAPGRPCLPPPRLQKRRRRRNPERPSQKAPSEPSRAATLAGFAGRSVSSTSSAVRVPVVVPSAHPVRSVGPVEIFLALWRTHAECRPLFPPFSRNATSSPTQMALARPVSVCACNAWVSEQSDLTG